MPDADEDVETFVSGSQGEGVASLMTIVVTSLT
jgi:hypothetical protein